MSGGGHGSPLPFFDFLEGLRETAYQDGGYLLPGIGLMIAGPVGVMTFLIIAPHQTFQNFEFLVFFAPLWLPFLLGRFALMRFVQQRRVRFISKEDTVLLEMRLPRDTRKSPVAMEAVFSNLHLASGEGTWYKRYFLGRARPWWSFELVSLGGRVHFFIWTRVKMRRPLEGYLYAQYPGIELVEATDYSRVVDPAHDGLEVWGCEYIHSRPDPYPIRTYVDYQLDKQPYPKPEEQVDPMSQIIETLGTMSPGEQLWIQFVIRVTRDEKYEGKKNAKGRRWSWRDEAAELVEKLRDEVTIKNEYVDPATGKLIKSKGFPNPTKGQSDTIAAIERNVGKLGFDVGIRTVYVATPETARGMGAVLTNVFKPFSSEMLNGFKAVRWSEHYNDYPWEDPGGHHEAHAMHELIEVYRQRSFYHPPYKGPWMIMSTEELASLYHVPSSTVSAPGLPRIQSTTTTAPPNLPT